MWLVWVISHKTGTSEGQNLGPSCPPACMRVCSCWCWDVSLITSEAGVSIFEQGFHIWHSVKHLSLSISGSRESICGSITPMRSSLTFIECQFIVRLIAAVLFFCTLTNPVLPFIPGRRVCKTHQSTCDMPCRMIFLPPLERATCVREPVSKLLLSNQSLSDFCAFHQRAQANSRRRLFIGKCPEISSLGEGNESWSADCNYIYINFFQLTACWPPPTVPFRKSPDCGLYRRWREILKAESSQFSNWMHAVSRCPEFTRFIKIVKRGNWGNNF